MSNNSYMGDGGSVISGLSRSRSNSRDAFMTKSFIYNPPTNTKGKGKSINHSEFGDLDD